MEEQKNRIRTLIAENDVDRVFEIFKQQNKGRLSNELVVLKSRYNKVKSESRAGIIEDEEEDRELAQINFALLELAENLGQDQPTKLSVNPSRSQKNPIPIVLLLAALIIGGYFVYQNFFPAVGGIQAERPDAPFTLTEIHYREVPGKYLSFLEGLSLRIEGHEWDNISSNYFNESVVFKESPEWLTGNLFNFEIDPEDPNYLEEMNKITNIKYSSVEKKTVQVEYGDPTGYEVKAEVFLANGSSFITTFILYSEGSRVKIMGAWG